MNSHPEPLELLSAFLDGEKVEPAALVEALSMMGSREALRDFALLRAEVQDDDSAPGPEAYRRINRALRPESRWNWWRWAIPIPAPALAATLLIAAAVVIWSGLDIGRGRGVPEDQPPVPDRVIHFQQGVDWHENKS